MEDIWNITALVVSVLSVLLSLYALRQATTKNTSDMYLFFISQYAKEDMKLALRKLKDIKRGVYRLEQWESDMKNNLPKAFEYDEARRLVKYFYDTLAYMKLEKLIEARFVRLICLKKGAWLYLDTVEAMEKFFDSGYDKKPYAVIRYAKIYEKKGVVLLSSCFRLLVILNKVLIEETIGALIFIS